MNQVGESYLHIQRPGLHDSRRLVIHEGENIVDWSLPDGSITVKLAKGVAVPWFEISLHGPKRTSLRWDPNSSPEARFVGLPFGRYAVLVEGKGLRTIRRTVLIGEGSAEVSIMIETARLIR